VKAAPDAQERLLELQGLDTRLDQLAHRQATLPEHEELQRLAARLVALHDDAVREETADSDLSREQTKVEAEVDLVRSRAERDQQRLDAGQVSSPRELENLQHEIASLGKRREALEDQVLEVMERREAIQERVTALRAEAEQVTAAQHDAEARRDAALKDISWEGDDARKRRDALAAELPGDLLALYEKVRAASGGLGAAALHRGQCQGCRLALSGSDLAAVRAAAPDEVVRCEECRRILVRTAESGL
jgi:predicted  nucleic acid-binding Zn-ribbon protein